MEKGIVDLADSLLELVGNERTAQRLIDLDWTVAADVAKHVPVVRELTSVVRLGLGIRERLFLRKLEHFLRHLKDVPQRKRAKFYTQLRSNARLRERVGTRLIILLDRLDDMEKPELVARAFQAFIDEKIDLETLFSMWVAIDRCAVTDFQYLQVFSGERSDLPAPVASAFYSTGITQLGALYPVGEGGSINNFQLSDFGQLFVTVVLVDSQS